MILGCSSRWMATGGHGLTMSVSMSLWQSRGQAMDGRVSQPQITCARLQTGPCMEPRREALTHGILASSERNAKISVAADCKNGLKQGQRCQKLELLWQQ